MAKKKKSSKRLASQEKKPTPKSVRRGIKRQRWSISAGSIFEGLKPHKALLVLVGIALLMRILTLGSQSLWIDEMCCWNDAAGSTRHILKTVHWVVFFLERASQRVLGPSEFALRLPSALVGWLGIVFIYLAALQITSRRVALVAAALMAFSPIHVYYSQDANYYAMMMGFTAATLYFMFRFFKTRNIPGLAVLFILWAVSNYLNFKVHPFNIFILIAEVGVFIIWFLLDRDFRDYWIGQLKRLIAKPDLLIPVVIVAGIGAGYLMFRFMPKFAHYIQGMLNVSQGTRLAENFEPSLSFFIKLATDYGLVFQDYTSFNFTFTIVFLILFVAGLVWYARQNRFVLLLTVLAWTLPFAGLLLVRASHFYHPRYTSFIVPLYLLGAAQGVSVISRFLAARAAMANKERIERILTYGILLVLAVALVPNLFRYYRGEKQDWKGAVKYLKKNLKPGDKVTSYLFCNNSSLGFYFRRLGMDTSVIEKLPEVRGAAFNDLYQLKKMCLGKGNVYFCTSYTRYEPRLIIDWVKEHFERVFYSPSLHPNEINREGKEVIVYRWKHREAYVFAPFEYHSEQESAEHQDEYSTQTTLLSKELFFDRMGTYDILLNFREPVKTDMQVSLLVDGRLEEGLVMKAGEQDFYEPPRSKVDLGVHSVTVASDISKENLASIFPMSLSISPTWEGKVRFHSYDADVLHPTGEKWVSKFAGRLAFVLKRNSYLKYENIFLPETGRYYFELSAANDKPGPILLEVLLDGKPIGIVSFDKADDSWDKRGFPFTAEDGKHEVALQFISNNSASSGDINDNDAIIEDFQISKEDISAQGQPDERLKIVGNLQEVPRNLESALKNAAKTGNLPVGWRVEPATSFDYVIGEAPGGKTAIKFEIPPFSKGLTLMSEPIDLSSGKVMYFSGNIKVRPLGNHSANIQMLYFDAGKRLLGAKWVNVEGVTQVTDWVRFCYFQPNPVNAKWAVIAYVVYANSRQPSESPGEVMFSDLNFESY